MANWIGLTRSNYFKVKDVEKFKEFVARFPELTLLNDEDATDEEPRFGFYENDGGRLPSERDVTDADGMVEAVEIDFVDELAKHLDKDVAVIHQAGYESARYASGFAIAVSHTGEKIELSLTDIYAIAFDEFGIQPSEAEL